MSKGFLALLGTTAAVGVVTLFSTVYTVEEGHVGVVTRFGEAVSVSGPGLHFKTPFVQGVEEIETRERRLAIDSMAASTREELPVAVAFSVNWALDRGEVLETYRQYGGLDQFETRVLRPVVGQAAKAAIAQYSASELLRDRSAAVQAAFTEIEKATARLPISINIPNFEDVALPEGYRQAVLRKEEARQNAEAEQQRLNQQKIESQQAVQTAQAQADALRAQASAEADAARLNADAKRYASEQQAAANLAMAQAEAEGIQKISESVTAEVIAYTRAKAWDGAQPRTILGTPPDLLLNLGEAP